MVTGNLHTSFYTPSSPFYAMLREFCHRSKNLYNHGNYLIRQTFIENGKWLRYGEVDRLLKADKDYPDYREMPTAQTAQQTLRLLDKNWTSFFAAIKDWKAHPEKYKGRPKLPKYKPKDGYFPLVLTNQNCKLKDGVIRFPRTFQGFTVKAIFASQPEAVFKQARIIPHGGEIDLELVYELLNADVNGAYQIMRKVFPNVNADGIEGVALRPAVVALSMSARRGSGCA